MGLVSLPFFLAHEHELGLHARLEAIQRARPALDRWALVAHEGRVARADDLAGMTILANPALAPAFVLGDVLGGLGALPASAQLGRSTAVLSALRRAANGEPVAVVVDGTQADSLASLPFAAKLAVVTRSPPMPSGLIVTIDARISDATWRKLEPALLALADDKHAADALAGVRLAGFAPVDDKALAAARTAFAAASRR